MHIVEMHDPENNDIPLEAVEAILDVFQNVDAVIYDRSCSILNAAKQMSSLKPINFWTLDLFHAKGHVRTFHVQPLANPSLEGAYERGECFSFGANRLVVSWICWNI